MLKVTLCYFCLCTVLRVSVDVVAYSQQTIACLQPSVFLCSSAFNDLCDVDAVVSWDVLIANTSSNAEPQTYNVM